MGYTITTQLCCCSPREAIEYIFLCLKYSRCQKMYISPLYKLFLNISTKDINNTYNNFHGEVKPSPMSSSRNEYYTELLKLPIFEHLVPNSCNCICWTPKDLHFLKPRANQSLALDFLTFSMIQLAVSLLRPKCQSPTKEPKSIFWTNMIIKIYLCLASYQTLCWS